MMRPDLTRLARQLIAIGSALTIFTGATGAQPFSGQLSSDMKTPEQKLFERIVREGTPLYGYLTGVDVELKNCVLTRSKKYDRQCGTAFDSSITTSEIEVINLSVYDDVFYSSQTGIISLNYKRAPQRNWSVTSSFREIRVCSGKIYREENATFLLRRAQPATDAVLKKDYEILQRYIRRNCL